MAVVRWDPFQEMVSLQERFNRMFGGSSERGWVPAIDITEKPDALVLRAELAGMKPEDLHIEVSDNVLTVKGERRQEEEREQDRYRSVEWRYGSFERSIALPRDARTDEIKATFENGVLELTIPKAEQAKPRSVEVEVKGGTQKTGQAQKAA